MLCSANSGYYVSFLEAAVQRLFVVTLLAVFCSATTFAQSQPPTISQASLVPRLVNFNGVATDVDGKALSGTVGITFGIYTEQQGGAPLWIETQNVSLKASGRYTVTLGSTKSDGIPVELFASGEARWVGVQLQGQAELARVLLVSVPYAMKAGDAATVGGLPPSAFVMAPTAPGANASAPGSARSRSAKSGVKPEFTSSGTTNYIPIFTDSSGDIGNSIMFQSSTGIGIGLTNPSAKMTISAPAGGAVLNATNDSDQDLFVTVSPPGASDKKTFFGPSVSTNLTLGVGGKEMMRITNNGNVGIGLSNPDARLTIAAPAGGAVLNATNYTDQDMFISLSAPNAADKKTYFGPSTNTNLTLGVNLTEMMRITNTGAVGINTTSPSAMLDVEGAAANAIVGVIASGVYEGIEGFGNLAGGYFSSAYFGSYSVGTTDSSFYVGVYGYEAGATQETIGVYGKSSSTIGIGTYGQAVSGSSEGGNFGGVGQFGVWGDTNTGGTFGSGVLATGDNNYALLAANNSATWDTAWFENDESSSPTQVILHTYGGAYGGAGCTIDVSGDLFCNGSKSAVVPVDGGSRKVALYAIEGPENWFEDAGGGQLHGGEAVVNLESVFGQTVNTDVDYRVFLTPNGDCKGLYVAQKSANSFVVRELGGGTSNIAFDYRIMAKRRGYEEVRLADKTELFSGKNRPIRRTGSAAKPMPTSEEIRKRVEKHVHKPKPRSVAQVTQGPLNKKQ
jgi:hypothetical protein